MGNALEKADWTKGYQYHARDMRARNTVGAIIRQYPWAFVWEHSPLARGFVWTAIIFGPLLYKLNKAKGEFIAGDKMSAVGKNLHRQHELNSQMFQKWADYESFGEGYKWFPPFH